MISFLVDTGHADDDFLDLVFGDVFGDIGDWAFDWDLSEGLSDEVYAVAFRKNDQKLRDTVDSILVAMKADGKFAEISAKWFGK